MLPTMRRMLPLLLLMLPACSPVAGSNAANNSGGGATGTVSGVKGTAIYDRIPLEDLGPPLDPIYLWPPDKSRIASTEFWGIWQTRERESARMLLSDDGSLWRYFGESSAITHDRLIDMTRFGSSVIFCVEYQDGEKRFRSRPRTVSFGQGAHFKDREMRMVIERKPEQKAEIALVGVDPATVADDLRFAQLPREVEIGFACPRGEPTGGKIILVADGSTFPPGGLYCYLEVPDRRTDTLDRIKVIVEVK